MLTFFSILAQLSAYSVSIETLFALIQEVLAQQTRIKYRGRFDPPAS